MSDRIEIRGIEAEGILGVHAGEQMVRRPILVDLDLNADLRDAASQDDLTWTADYAAVVERVRAVASERPRRLVEALAQEIADACLTFPAVRSVTVTVHKPGCVPGVADVAVRITR